MEIITPILMAVLMAVGIYVILFKEFDTIGDHSVHVKMVQSHCEKYYYGTFEQFLEEFSKRKWERKMPYRDSWFGIGNDYYGNEIHAKIIKFDGNGIILVKRDWPKFEKWVKANRMPEPIITNWDSRT